VTASLSVPSGTYDISVKPKNACGTDGVSFAQFKVIKSGDPCSGVGPMMTLYPNPAENYFYIAFEGQDEVEQYEIILLNHFGIEVFSKLSKLAKERINTSKLPKGFYYLNVIHKEGILRKQIIIEK
jgi:hypothetical protein